MNGGNTLKAPRYNKDLSRGFSMALIHQAEVVKSAFSVYGVVEAVGALGWGSHDISRYLTISHDAMMA